MTINLEYWEKMTLVLVHGNLRMSNFAKKQFFGLDYKLKNKKQPFRATPPPSRRTCTVIHSIIMAPAPKGEHVFQHCQGKHSKRNCTRHRQASFPTLTSVSTAKGNITNKIVLGTDKLHSLNKTGQTLI